MGRLSRCLARVWLLWRHRRQDGLRSAALLDHGPRAGTIGQIVKSRNVRRTIVPRISARPSASSSKWLKEHA